MKNFDLEKRTILPEVTCVNCNQQYEGYFCPKCGQRELKGRFTFKESSGWIFDKIFNLERGIFFTVKELMLRPRQMLSQYLNRATVRFMHPFRFVFLMATLSALFTILSGTFESAEISEALRGYVDGWNGHEGKEQLTVDDLIGFIETIKKYLAFLFILNIPINSLASYIVFNKYKNNFTEHLIINCYTYGFSLLIGMPLFLFMLLKNGLIIYSTINSFLYLGAYVYIFSRFFQENFFKGFFKILLVFLITTFLTSIAVFIGLIAVSILFMK